MEIFIFILGTMIGSFLNVCIYRIPQKKSIVFPFSYCPKCNIRLEVLDLIPVVSFLSAKGKCRYCSKKISIQYTLIELLNGLVYLLAYLRFGFTIEFIGYSILCSILIVIGIIDCYHQIIPNFLNIHGIICALIFQAFTLGSFLDFFNYILGFLTGGGFLLLIAIVTNGAMGGGDIKLMAMLGFWLGWRLIILNLFLSFLIGGIVSIILILFKFKNKKDMIPFGPFIVIATILTIFYGNNIINYYIVRFVIY